MARKPDDQGATLGEVLYGLLPSAGPPAWQPADDPFPVPPIHKPYDDPAVLAWYKRNQRRALRELCNIPAHVQRIQREAFERGQKATAVMRWVRRHLEGLHLRLLEVLICYPVLSAEWVAALKALDREWAALFVPDRLTGRVKRQRIDDAELPALLSRHEELKRRATEAMQRRGARGRKFFALADAFPDLPPELCDVSGRFYPEKFAKAALAHEYECAVGTIEKALTRARKHQP